MGRDEFSCSVFKELYNAHDVWQELCIATHPDEKVGRRGSKLSVSPLKLLGESLNVPVHTIPRTKPEFRTWKPPHPFSTDPQNSSHLLVTASFGRILSAPLLNLFLPTKRLNLHPSLLPKYRGAAPIQHTILNGDKETGVCVIEMLKRKEGIDAGAIWGSTKINIKEDATFVELRDELAKEGGKVLVDVLKSMLNGTVTQVQIVSSEPVPHAPMISSTDSSIWFASQTAELIVTRHRAISHQRPLTAQIVQNYKAVQLHSPSVHTETPPSVLSATPGSAIYYKPTSSLLIRCAEDTVLSVPLLKSEGKALLCAKDWWNGASGLGLVDNNEIAFAS
ncbi:hypothetical protein AX16_004437 [Volvariella volvacea WC 439]|nr:hypothetical protein AX16_004437 [Volvariella volvacea WC 439]